MFTTAALGAAIFLVALYGGIANWKRDRKWAIGLIALNVLPALLIAAAIHGLVTNQDPLDWIRQPVPCRFGVC
jgi:hypothetical protein